MHSHLQRVTRRIVERSQATRERYLHQMQEAARQGVVRKQLPCANLAHAMAACGPQAKDSLRMMNQANIGIVTAYNDMLSAHQPFERFPALIRQAVAAMGSVAQVAGGVPAMCDGVTQGEPGMELSLASRDVIALSTAVALSHNVFDGVICLGVCDKIAPGLLIGALRFGHLPMLFAPAGPMTSGIPNKEKAEVRQRYAAGEVSREALLESEMRSYHSPGTCTFYGTANTNQMLMEVMGLHLPGASFVNPDTPLREALTYEAAQQLTRITALGSDYRPLCRIVDERAIVNAVVALLASGGSTNLTIHLVAIAKAAGIQLRWQDMAELSEVVPTLAKVYPNGQADINQFQAAGGTALLFRELLGLGLLHEDVLTVWGDGLTAYTQEPGLREARLSWHDGPRQSLAPDILRTAGQPFAAEAGLHVLEGNLGRAVLKLSAVNPAHWTVEAPCRVFDSQQQLVAAFERGELEQDLVVVVRFQGPHANGMPELHKLMPYLGLLQDRGFKVALVTDGRLSGASGKVPAALHLTPEASDDGLLRYLRDGDRIRVDGRSGHLHVLEDEAAVRRREPASSPEPASGCGRELFAFMRRAVGTAEQGGSCFGNDLDNLLH